MAAGFEIDLPQPASSLLKAAECSLGFNSTRCVAEPDNDDSDDLVNSMREEDIPNDADRAEQLSDRIDSLSNIIDDMNGYERDILDRTLVEFLYDTKDAVEESRVYGIAIDHTNKRILVAFRASSSHADWRRDFDLPLESG